MTIGMQLSLGDINWTRAKHIFYDPSIRDLNASFDFEIRHKIENSQKTLSEGYLFYIKNCPSIVASFENSKLFWPVEKTESAVLTKPNNFKRSTVEIKVNK